MPISREAVMSTSSDQPVTSGAAPREPAAGQGSICLTFDFDTIAVWMAGFRAVTPGVLSRGEFGGRVGIWRVLGVLDRYQLPATFFIPGYTADTFPEAVRAIAERGHEIGHHGYLHESPTLYLDDPDGARAMYEKGLEALGRVAGVRPAGYRSPGWDLTGNSIALLEDLGFRYDSSLAADDYHCYFARTGDVPRREGGFQFGEPSGIVEIPVSWSWDDFPQFEFVSSPGFTAGNLASPSKVFEIWSGDIDFMVERVPGGVFDLTMHPQVIGRGHRIKLLEQVIEHCLQYPGLRFARMAEVAEDFRARATSAAGEQ
jgi:peptidoglycan/xylan/chitin deacetylase (PgdA/CDA1 family)